MSKSGKCWLCDGSCTGCKKCGWKLDECVCSSPSTDKCKACNGSGSNESPITKRIKS